MNKHLTLKYIVIFLLSPLSTFAQADSRFAKFVPAGYRIFKEIHGDLNKDGIKDYFLIIKGTEMI